MPGFLQKAVKTPDGHKAVVLLIPFGGDGDGRHRFSDHGHARNFVRYMFSQSRAHPETPQTCLNLFREYGEDGALALAERVANPAAQLQDFMDRRFPPSRAETLLCDDGCYPLFGIRMKGRPFVSNFIRRDRDGGATVEHPLFQDLNELMAEAGADFESSGPASRLEEIMGAEPGLFLENRPESGGWPDGEEAFLHMIIRNMMGDGAKVMMTISHRDQAGHNEIYHLHRLLRM